MTIREHFTQKTIEHFGNEGITGALIDVKTAIEWAEEWAEKWANNFEM